MDKRNIESIVPLLPMQESFLWHSLKSEPQASVIQVCCTLTGNIDLSLLNAAWGVVVAQHQALRSTVHWEDVPKPVQVVHKQMPIDIRLIDRNEYSSYEQFICDDQTQGLKLGSPPPYRLSLYPAAKDTIECIWSMSHVLLDGWSSSIVISDWVNAYHSLLNRQTVAGNTPLPLSDQSRWLKQQNQTQLLDYWDHYLPATFNTEPVHFQTSNTSSPLRDLRGICKLELQAETYSRITQSLRANGISLNTLLQAAFAIVLQPAETNDAVVFTTTVSGRHIDIENIEKRVGMMINMLPVCVRFEKTELIKDWLQSLQASFFECLPHAHASPQQIAALRNNGSELYRSLLVIENQPTVSSTPSITLSNYRSAIISEFDLTLAVIPANTLSFELVYDEGKFSKELVTQVLSRLVALVETMPGSLNDRVSQLDKFKIATARSMQDLTIAVDLAATAELEDKKDNSGITQSTLLSHQMHEIWCDVLNVDSVAPHHNFFDIGGTSLQAIVLFEAIDRKLKIRLPATTLFHAPTIEALVDAIGESQPETASLSVIAVNPNGALVPVFIVFEQLDMLMYQPLIVELGNDQPVYGLQIPQGSYPSKDALQVLVDQIQSIYPAGPYQLAGLSGAGIAAWDLAQSLRHSNKTVDLLVLLDSYGPDYPTLLPPVARLGSAAKGFCKELIKVARRASNKLAAKVFSNNGTQKAAHALVKEKAIDKQSKFTDQYLKHSENELALARQLLQETSTNSPFSERLVNSLVFRLNRWNFRSINLRIDLIVFMQGLLLDYKRKMKSSVGLLDIDTPHSHREPDVDDSQTGTLNPSIQTMLNRFDRVYGNLQPYSGRVLYCKAKQRAASVTDDPMVGWSNLITGDITMVTIPGDHRSILKPENAVFIASAMKSAMADVSKQQD